MVRSQPFDVFDVQAVPGAQQKRIGLLEVLLHAALQRPPSHQILLPHKESSVQTTLPSSDVTLTPRLQVVWPEQVTVATGACAVITRP